MALTMREQVLVRAEEKVKSDYCDLVVLNEELVETFRQIISLVDQLSGESCLGERIVALADGAICLSEKVIEGDEE